MLLNKLRSLPLSIECTYDLNRYFETTCPRGSVERTRQFYGQVVSCLTKVTKSVWAGLLLCVIHYSIARVRLPVHKANLDIVVNTQFLWSRSTCKYLVQSYLICSSSLAYNLNNSDSFCAGPLDWRQRAMPSGGGGVPAANRSASGLHGLSGLQQSI